MLPAYPLITYLLYLITTFRDPGGIMLPLFRSVSVVIGQQPDIVNTKKQFFLIFFALFYNALKNCIFLPTQIKAGNLALFPFF